MKQSILVGLLFGMAFSQTPSLAVTNQSGRYANHPDDTATPESIMQEIQDKHMCDIKYAHRKALLMNAFREGLTPANQSQKMTELQAALNRLNQEKQASDAWRAARLKVYGEKLAKLTPEARRAVVTRQMDQATESLQNSIESMNNLVLDGINLNRRLFPQLGQPLTQEQWKALSPEQQKALLERDKQRTEAISGKR